MKKLSDYLFIFSIVIIFPVIIFAQADNSFKTDSILTNSTALNFLVVSDWARSGEGCQRQIAEQKGIVADKINAKCIVSAGNNIHLSGVICFYCE